MLDRPTKKIVFLTGTRADYGKIRPIMQQLDFDNAFSMNVFVTGMHMIERYGHTYLEVEKDAYTNIHKFINQNTHDSMDQILAKTISGFSDYVREEKPDLIFVHGDRIEALAGAIVGQLNGILLAHIEGGELSGTVDEMVRHAITKLSHVHFVSNATSKSRLIQMGECPKTIFEVGSPDVDTILSKNLPSIDEVKDYYGINFETYGLAILHPVTTELANFKDHAHLFFKAIKMSNENFVVILPNNDSGKDFIFNEIAELKDVERFRVIPSMRFEYYLSLLKHAGIIFGNSSSGVREAPYFGTAVVNVGTRQDNRVVSDCVINVGYSLSAMLDALQTAFGKKYLPEKNFGDAGCSKRVQATLRERAFWDIEIQKTFVTLQNVTID